MKTWLVTFLGGVLNNTHEQLNLTAAATTTTLAEVKTTLATREADVLHLHTLLDEANAEILAYRSALQAAHAGAQLSKQTAAEYRTASEEQTLTLNKHVAAVSAELAVATQKARVATEGQQRVLRDHDRTQALLTLARADFTALQARSSLLEAELATSREETAVAVSAVVPARKKRKSPPTAVGPVDEPVE